MLIQVMILVPPTIWTTEIYNDHGKLMATVMAEEALQAQYAIAMHVGNSMAAQG
jgi:L-ascorbate metabolism protein UlaG (beta-lactamase superfamily)